jgi:sulfite exporter TauE/SafE
MTAFWLGTVPSLVAVGLGAQLIGAPLRRHVPALTAILLVALGVFAILARPTSVTAAISTHEHSQRMVPSLSESTPYCCAD